MATLIAKLQFKPGQTVTLLNIPPEYQDLLAQELGGLNLHPPAGSLAQAGLLFTHNLEELNHLAPGAVAAVIPDGLVWIAYPKGGSGIRTDLNRDRLAAALAPFGLSPVRLIALDDTWSVMRFRPTEKVGR